MGIGSWGADVVLSGLIVVGSLHAWGFGSEVFFVLRGDLGLNLDGGGLLGGPSGQPLFAGFLRGRV